MDGPLEIPTWTSVCMRAHFSLTIYMPWSRRLDSWAKVEIGERERSHPKDRLSLLAAWCAPVAFSGKVCRWEWGDASRQKNHIDTAARGARSVLHLATGSRWPGRRIRNLDRAKRRIATVGANSWAPRPRIARPNRQRDQSWDRTQNRQRFPVTNFAWPLLGYVREREAGRTERPGHNAYLHNTVGSEWRLHLHLVTQIRLFITLWRLAKYYHTKETSPSPPPVHRCVAVAYLR